MKRTIQLLKNLWHLISRLVRQSSMTFIAKNEEEQLDHHTISISTR